MKCQIPGIIGAIDGSHIPIKQPPGNSQDFYNRKQFHSIILQGNEICKYCLISRNIKNLLYRCLRRKFKFHRYIRGDAR